MLRPDVEADLKFSPEQVAECHRAARVFQIKASRLIGRKDPAVVAARREIDEELTNWLTEHLSPEQLGRFEQVDLQWEGAAAMLNRPFLDNALKLTPEQKKQVSDFLAQSRLERSQRVWTYDDHINLTRKAIAVLNDSQRSLWIRLLGPKCQFAIARNAQVAQGRPKAADGSMRSAPVR